MQDLFTSIDNYLAQEGHYAFRVRLDASHPVYRGHFPGHPVLPGVCTLQLVRECLNRGTGRRFRYAAIRECKFLGMVVPQADELLEIDIRVGDDTPEARGSPARLRTTEKRCSNSGAPYAKCHDHRAERHTGGDPDLQQRKDPRPSHRRGAPLLHGRAGGERRVDRLDGGDNRRGGVGSISYAPNRGKGYALRRALRYAAEHGYRYMLTIDSDGQHYASDIPKFVEEIAKTPDALLVGARNLRSDNMPGKNTFANKFSNFWFLRGDGHPPRRHASRGSGSTPCGG